VGEEIPQKNCVIIYGKELKGSVYSLVMELTYILNDIESILGYSIYIIGAR
jgi:hypothetical protein